MLDDTLDLVDLIGADNMEPFWRHWPLESMPVHQPLERLARISDIPELANVQSLLQCLRRATDLRVRVWFQTGNGGLEQVTVDAIEAEKLYRSNCATVVVDNTQSLFPPISDLMHNMRSQLGIPKALLSCNIYASPPGVGSIMHFDQQENFFVQLRGAKRWRTARNRHVEFPHTFYFGGPISKDLRLLCDELPRTMPEDATTVTLRPGSVLFLPRGYWHESFTEEHSLALTLTFQVATWRESILKVLSRRLLVDQTWRRPVIDSRTTPENASPWHTLATQKLEDLKRVINSTEVMNELIDTVRGAERFVVSKDLSWQPAGDGGNSILVIRADGTRKKLDCDAVLFPLLLWIRAQQGSFVWADAIGRIGLRPGRISNGLRAQLVSEGLILAADEELGRAAS